MAKTHTALGFGHMAARREKVSRWESGRVEPELTAQFAIACLHHVPRELVERLGWPHWLHAAIGKAPTEPNLWTVENTAEALRDAVRSAQGQSRSYLTVSGNTLSSLTDTVITILNSPPVPPERNGCRTVTTNGTATLLEAHITALEDMQQQLDAALLCQAARTEVQLLAELLTDTGYDRDTGIRLHHLAARAAGLCAEHALIFGDVATAETFSVASIQMSTMVGHAEMAAFYMYSLAASHLEAGDPCDSLHLVEVARRAAPKPSPCLVTLFFAREAQAWALLGRRDAAARAIEAAFASYGSTTEAVDSDVHLLTKRWLTQRWLNCVAGTTWLSLGEPRRALSYFMPLSDGKLALSADSPDCVALELLYTAKAYLATDELEQAVRSAGHAVQMLSTLSAHFLRQIRQLFLPHQAVPRVQDFLAKLAVWDVPGSAFIAYPTSDSAMARYSSGEESCGLERSTTPVADGK
ncbi:hypothetical protein ACH4GK_42445 [Streptomyces rimosus]|uniref:hypothetical protein n=1 Tax=Streptomyces rimosus TaxID=1927 RepID=UPI00131BABAE|nr:hypothetical protein [Streptomyces rimosus]